MALDRSNEGWTALLGKDVVGPDGKEYPTRGKVQFKKSGAISEVEIADDEANGRTVVTFPTTAETAVFGELVAAARAAVPDLAEDEIFYLVGHTTPGDGGEGYFRKSSVDAVDDDGTVLNEGGFGTSQPGLRRIYSGLKVDLGWFGAKGDAVVNSNGVNIGLGATTFAYGLTDPELAEMIGDLLIIEGAGADKAPHITTITNAVGGVVTFADATLSAVTGATFTHGTDNTVPFQRAIDALIAKSSGVTDYKSATLRVPPGKFLTRGGIRCTKFDAGQWWFTWLRIEGDSRPQQGNPNASTILCGDPEQALFIVQTGTVAFKWLAMFGRNAWSGIDGNLTTLAESYYEDEWDNAIANDLAEAPWVKKGCRDNRYSPHCAIVVDPYHSTVAGGDQYPGQAARYVNAGGSTGFSIEECWIQDFVLGIGLGLNPVTQNVEANILRDTIVINCKTPLAIGQSQSRNTRISGGIWQGADWCHDCQGYGQGNGTPPEAFGGQYGGGGIIRTANSGHPGHYSGIYAGESLTRIAHCASDSVVFDDCPFGFFPTPAGKPAFVKAMAIPNPKTRVRFRDCNFYDINGTAETFWFHNVIFEGQCTFPTDPADHSFRWWSIGAAETAAEGLFNAVSAVKAGNYSYEGGRYARLLGQEAGILSTPAPRGGAFLTTTLDDEPVLRWIDSTVQLAIVGPYDVTFNADGTATIDGTDLDEVFAIGQIVDCGGLALGNVIDGAPGQTVPVHVGKVSAVTATEVTVSHVPTYVADEYVGAGTQNFSFFKYSRHDVHQATTGVVGASGAEVTLSPATYWQRYMPIRDEDGFLGTHNYIANKVGSVVTLAKTASIASGDIFPFDQPTWELVLGFATQQPDLPLPGRCVGQVNGALYAQDVNLQCFTPRTARAAFVAAGSTDKDSGDGAWTAVGGWGSAYATTAFQSHSGVKFGGNADNKLLFVSCDYDGANEAIAAELTKTGDLTLPGLLAYDTIHTRSFTDSTSDATPVNTLVDSPLVDDAIYVYTVVASARGPDATDRAAWIFNACFEVTSGTVALVGTVDKVFEKKGAGAAAWDLSLSTDGTDILAAKTGDASQTVAWKFSVQAVRSS